MEIDFNNPAVKKMMEDGLQKQGKLNPIQGPDAGGVKGSSKKVNKDDFLKILMAEVKNQDPFNPMDTKQYGSHLAQFSQLEQMVNMNTNLGKMSGNQNITNRNELVAYIGKEIHAKNDSFEYTPGKNALVPFNLSKDAENVDLNIFDTEGKLVKTVNLGRKAAGLVNAPWDGLTNDGIISPQGKFSFKVEAKNAFGVNIPTDGYIKGKVTGVSFEDNKPLLLIGETKVEPTNVMKVLFQDN